MFSSRSFSWSWQNLRKVIVVTLLLFNGTSFQLMLHFLRFFSFLGSTNVPLDPLHANMPTSYENVTLQPIVFVPPESIIFVPPLTARPTPILGDPPIEPSTPRPLQTYHYCQPSSIVQVLTHVPDNEVIPDSPSSLTPLLDQTIYVLIAIGKGIRPTRNSSSRYIDLCYHCLSPLHYTCLSSLSCFYS